MKILLAEDDSHMRQILQLWLEQKGHHVESVENGRKALTYLQNHKYDILITDVNMPLINGVDLVDQVLEYPRQPELIILLTSRCDIQQLQKRFDDSRVHFFSKPFSPVLLTDKIEKLGTRSADQL